MMALASRLICAGFSFRENSLRLAAIVFIMQCIYSSPAQECPQEHVILLHGGMRSTNSMSRIERALAGAGYTVHNIDYSTRNSTILDISEDVIGNAIATCEQENARKIDFITHSTGGILVRSYLKRHSIPSLGCVVMLGPPNQGSEVANILGRLWIVTNFYHTAMSELTTDTNSTARTLGPANFCLGVIAGDRSFNWLYSLFIPGKDDGMVAVNSTKLTGMTDHIVIHTTHTFMVYNHAVIKETMYFLKNGKFEHFH